MALGEYFDTYRDTIENNQLGVAPSLRFGIGTQTDITLAYYYLKTKSVTDYGQPTLTNIDNRPPPVGLNKYYGLANYDYSNWDTNWATFKIDHRFSSSLSLRNQLRWSNFKRDMEATIGVLNKTVDAVGNKVTATTPVERLLVTQTHNKARDNDDTVLINQTDLTWNVATGAIKHTVLGGMEFSSEELDRQNYTFIDPATGKAPTATTLLLHPDPYAFVNYTKTPNQRSIAEADTVALYLQDQLQLSQQWKALLGVRWDRLDSTVQTQNALTGVIVNGGGPFSRTDDMWSGRAGLIWQPTDAQSYYISGGNSYNPSGQLGVYGANGTNLTATNDDLEPEENRIYEVGSQWDFNPGVSLRAAAFRNEKINQRIPPSRARIFHRYLAGSAVSMASSPALAGSLTPNWDIYGAFAWLHGEIVKSNVPATEGKEPDGTPYTSGNVWTIYRLGGGWEIGGGAFASAGWYLNDANTARVPSYIRLDATIAYVRPKYEIRLNIINLTDEVYYVGGYENSGNRVIAGQPLTALVTGTYRFD